jgi:hypothetical protein
MGGVIVVDAGRSRSTRIGHDAYVHDHCHEYVITMRFSINCPTVICLPTVCYVFEREASSENYGPRVIYPSYIKSKIPCCNFISFILFCNLLICLSLSELILASNRQGDWQPSCLCWVQVFAFVCVGATHEVLCGSPTRLITLVLNWGKYLSLLYCIILCSSGKSQRSLQVAGAKPMGIID